MILNYNCLITSSYFKSFHYIVENFLNKSLSCNYPIFRFNNFSVFINTSNSFYTICFDNKSPFYYHSSIKFIREVCNDN